MDIHVRISAAIMEQPSSDPTVIARTILAECGTETLLPLLVAEVAQQQGRLALEVRAFCQVMHGAL